MRCGEAVRCGEAMSCEVSWRCEVSWSWEVLWSWEVSCGVRTCHPSKCIAPCLEQHNFQTDPEKGREGRNIGQTGRMEEGRAHSMHMQFSVPLSDTNTRQWQTCPAECWKKAYTAGHARLGTPTRSGLPHPTPTESGLPHPYTYGEWPVPPYTYREWPVPPLHLREVACSTLHL